MRKIIAIGMSFILLTGALTGCKKMPGDKETAKRLQEMYGGERFEVSGGNASSLDRDLEFEVWYNKDGADIWPDIEIGGDYALYSSYSGAVCHYWNDEYRECIEKYGFSEVDYGEDGEDEDACQPNLVYIFIEEGASSQSLDDVESLLKDLREICRKEDDFHDSGSGTLRYIAYIWFIDSSEEKYLKNSGIRIESDTKDNELRFDDMDDYHEEKTDPRKPPLSGGNAKIYVY